MRVLVTGANGQLGRDVTKVLAEAGHTVTAASRAVLDLARPDTIEPCLVSVSPDCVVNCAAYTQVDRAEEEPDLCRQVNDRAVGVLAESVARRRAHLIHLSTDYVFDGLGCRPYTEEHTTAPRNVYGRSKADGERRIADSGADAAVLRTAWLYGVQGTNFVHTMLRLGQERDHIMVVDDQVGTPTWTMDLARVIRRLIELRATGIWHFTNEGVCSWYDFAHAIFAEAARSGLALRVRELVPVPTEAFPRPASRPAYSVLDKRKLRAVLGWPIPHWRDSLASMIREVVRP